MRKHAIKCVDRLLANPRIEGIRTRVGAAVARVLFETNPNPVLLVDWTEAGPGFWALSVAIPIGGRLPEEVVAIYALRMQIEETFRDTKSHRFGWSFEDAGSRSDRRLNNLLLIAVLGAYVTIVFGIAAEEQHVHVGLRANTIRHRRVFSLFFLGRTVMSMPGLYERLRSRFRAAIVTLGQLVRNAGLPSVANVLSPSAR